MTTTQRDLRRAEAREAGADRDASSHRSTGAQDARLSSCMQALVRHLHAFVREVRLTEAEWSAAIEFLTAVGHITDERRQEFVLLSRRARRLDADRRGEQRGRTATRPRPPSSGRSSSTTRPPIELGGDIAGGAPGEPCWVEGTVTRHRRRRRCPARAIEVWEADEDGFYDVQYDDGRVCGRGAPVRGRRRRATGSGALHPTPYPIPDDGPVGAPARRDGPLPVPRLAPALHGDRSRAAARS